MRPDPRYRYTLVFYLQRSGDADKAVKVIRDVTDKAPTYEDPYLLMGEIYEKQGRKKEAEAIYGQALGKGELSRSDRSRIEAKLNALTSGVSK